MGLKRSPTAPQKAQQPKSAPEQLQESKMLLSDDSEDELMTPSFSIKKVNLKRGGDKIERSNDDLHNTIVNLGIRLSNEFKTECQSIRQDLTKTLNEKFDSLHENVEEIRSKVNKVEKSTEMNATRLDQHGKILNRLLQEKLQNKMEINGIALPRLNDKNEIKKEVVKIIKSFGINLELDSIKSVYIRNVKGNDNSSQSHNKQIINVEFKDFDTKVKVIRDKKKSKIRNGIFFDEALTPTNKFLIGKAKKMAKEKNFMVYLNNNRINIKKSENQIKWIEDEKDLEDVKNWEANEKTERQNTSNQIGQQTTNDTIMEA